MKTNPSTRRNRAAFTRKDPLGVVAILPLLLLVLASVLLSARTAPARPGRNRCVNNQKEIGTAFRQFSEDHDERYPLQATTGSYIFQSGQKGRTNGAVASDSAQAWQVFQSLRPYLPAPKVLICPKDATRVGALKRVQDFDGLAGAPGVVTKASLGHPSNQNLAVSYAPQALADGSRPNGLLAVERNINYATSATATNTPGAPSGRRLGVYSPGAARSLYFVTGPGSQLHDLQGNILFADGSVQQATVTVLQTSLINAGTAYGWGTATSNGFGAAVFLLP